MPEARHFGYSLSYKITVNRGRRAERSYRIAVYNRYQLLWVEIVEIVNHNRAADQPLTVQLAPRRLCPAGLGDRKVQSAVLRPVPVLSCYYMSERIGMVVYNALGITCRARSKVKHHRVVYARFNALKGIGSAFHSLA